MTFLIPVFIVLTIILFSLAKKNTYRDSFVKSLLLTSFVILFSTEILSVFNKVTYNWIFITWILSLSLIALLLLINWQSIKKGASEIRSAKPNQKKTSPIPIVLLSGTLIASILIINLVISLKAPPNNYDSMTYHMARVSHWIQNQSIRYFPTSIPRQNYSMPLAEYSILHLQLLSKSDGYANLVQWVCFILSIVLSSLIARELKISTRGQWITALLTATLPIVILQSSSTQNDLVVGAFCLGFAYFLLRSINDPNLENLFFVSLSMGFALATKGTAYVFCAAIGISIAGIHLLGKNWSEIKKQVLKYMMIVVIALLLNTGIYSRNWQLYNNPILPSNEKTINDEFSAKVLFSNLVRNGAAHLATPAEGVNQFLNRSVSNLLGTEIDNPASTAKWSTYQISFIISEDDSGNFLHFIFLTFSILLFPWLKKEQPKTVNSFFLSILLSIFLFSFLFKWQPWGSRLQIPIFLLGSVIIGFIIDRISTRKIIPGLLVIGFFLFSLPYLVMNPLRPALPLWEDDTVFYNNKIKEFLYTQVTNITRQSPIMENYLSSFLSLFYEGRSVIITDRNELYFFADYDKYYEYRKAAKLVREYNPQEVGLWMDSNDWEYPLWVYLRRHASQGSPNIYHINVFNESAASNSSQNPYPEIIIDTNDDNYQMENYDWYELIYSSEIIRVHRLKE